jgi:hypothetical protein
VLRLTHDVGAFTDRGDDLSGVETLAACLVPSFFFLFKTRLFPFP